MLTPIKNRALYPTTNRVANRLNDKVRSKQLTIEEPTLDTVFALSHLNHVVRSNLNNDRPARLNFRSGFRHFTDTCAVWWRLIQKSSRPSQGLWYELSGKH